MERLRIACAGLILILTTSSCAPNQAGLPSAHQKLIDRNAPLRRPSISAWKGQHVGQQRLLEFALERTVWVIDGANRFDFVEGNENKQWRYGGYLDQQLATTQIGSATPIADGYFLTAAHCVESSNILLVGANSDSPAYQIAAEVIWNGLEQDKPVDLALLWAPGLDIPAFAWTEQTPALGTDVLCCGSGANGACIAAGRIISYSADADSLRVDVPLLPGDSGGPCLLPDGSLLGITCAVEIQGKKATGLIRIPDRVWLSQRISDDRTQRSGQQPPPRRLSTAGTTRLLQIRAELESLYE